MQSCLNKYVAKHATPQFQEDLVNQYQTADKVFKHLKSIFFNLNCYITARH